MWLPKQPAIFGPTLVYFISVFLLEFAWAFSTLADEPVPNKGENLWQFVVLGQLEFASDRPMDKSQLYALQAQFISLEVQLNDELQVPKLNRPLRIYLFHTQKSFAQHLKKWIPSISWSGAMCRRGMFLLRQRQPYVFLVVSEELTVDFRHECTHALMNLTHAGLPIWLDEGLAQCYEAEDGSHWKAEAFDILRNDWLGRSPPKVAQLAELKQMADFGRREYAGAWVQTYHWLSDPQIGRPYLCRFLNSLRSDAPPGKFSEPPPTQVRLETLKPD